MLAGGSAAGAGRRQVRPPEDSGTARRRVAFSCFLHQISDGLDLMGIFSAANPTLHLKSFSYPRDIFHMSVWERSDWTNLLSCQVPFRFAHSTRLPVGVRVDGCASPPRGEWCWTKLSPNPFRRREKSQILGFALLLRRKCRPVVIKLPTVQRPHCGRHYLHACSSFSLAVAPASILNRLWLVQSAARLCS